MNARIDSLTIKQKEQYWLQTAANGKNKIDNQMDVSGLSHSNIASCILLNSLQRLIRR